MVRFAVTRIQLLFYRLGVYLRHCPCEDVDSRYFGGFMKIHLDTEKCQGHGRCYSLAPDLFDCDDLGTAVVIVTGDLNDEQLAKAKLAAGNCPEFAITIGD